MTEKETFNYACGLIAALKNCADKDGANWDLVRLFILVQLNREEKDRREGNDT